jgi:hypothetical protein
MVYRGGYYGEDHTEAEIIVQKNRNGIQGTVQLVWNPGCTRFEEPPVGEKVEVEKSPEPEGPTQGDWLEMEG